MAKGLCALVLWSIVSVFPLSDALACKCDESGLVTNLRARPGPGETVGAAADRIWVRAFNWEGGEAPEGWLHTPDGKRLPLKPGQFSKNQAAAWWSYLLPKESFAPGTYIVELNPGLGDVWFEGAERIGMRDPVPLKATDKFKGALVAWQFHRKTGGEASSLGFPAAKRAVRVQGDGHSDSCSTGDPAVFVVFGITAPYEELFPLLCVWPSPSATEEGMPLCDLIPPPEERGMRDPYEFALRFGQDRICEASGGGLREGMDTVVTSAMDWSGTAVPGSQKVLDVYADSASETHKQAIYVLRSILRPWFWIPAATVGCGLAVWWLLRRRRRRKSIEESRQTTVGGGD